jgi:poly-gamma-glutamate synthesis protein (capsule biosynthesis protein)
MRWKVFFITLSGILFSFTPGMDFGENIVTLFLCGDVMTGRGVDQILHFPSAPGIYESYVRDARDYVALAESVNGPIPIPVNFSYIWGDALAELRRIDPDVSIINLETAITRSSDYWKGKGINYRMSPANTPVLTAAGIDVCALANNHVLDWGYDGLEETLTNLKQAEILYTGAGRSMGEAEAPAIVGIPAKWKVIVFSFGLKSSGIPTGWMASETRAGVNLLPDLSDNTVDRIKELTAPYRTEGNIIIASIHWGGNWGYKIPPSHRTFAHALIEEAGVDIIHGHSSHHVKGIEVYQGKLILYGCGDFLNDYEGIGSYEEFRGDLSLMYFAAVDPVSGDLLRLELLPMQIRKMQAKRASRRDASWLSRQLNELGKELGTGINLTEDIAMYLTWEQQ